MSLRASVESGMKLLTLTFLVFTFAISVVAQTPSPSPAAAPPVKEANPADVGSIDAIMKAVYDVISADAGQKRDWDRFRSLFHKDAKLIPTGKSQAGGVARFWTPEEYITRAGPGLERDGFHERELSKKVEQYGTIAHVFSTYVTFRKKDDKDPFMRGINSFQLWNDGKRWWVISIYWLAETPDNPIPAKYLN